MKKPALAKLLLALGLLAVAVVLFIQLYPSGAGGRGDAYFYDLAEQRLFVAPQGSIPPIAGVHGAAGAGVRAIVICTNGNPADRAHLAIAYLEKYSPEIKQLFEEVRQARLEGRSEEGRINKKDVPPNTLVRRLEDQDWHPLNTPEGRETVNAWKIPGPDGQLPAICSP